MNIIKTTFVALMLTASAAHANIVVTFDPSTTDISVGDTFTVDVLATTEDAFTDAFLAFDIGFGFDESLLGLDSSVLGSAFDVPFSTFFDIAGFANSFPVPVSGVDILLATLTFTASSAGDLVLDLDGGSFSLGDFVDFESTALNITVSEVSAPATLGLFAIALVGLINLRRKA
ncbi:PEP-CTERM sorting domain-containing protein [Paraglaciecola arctica]|uniref:PEP-CTERM sorting domain-containing protein n=1 Tax=Paraglaciecola arctica TaxID=1128911 RepID=UPI001C07DDBB|nr:PEP-CTERM sorting domain-containing protein [Paraglaciecola arctica]MBU3004379.1 PEP-CTERM sorting domain-containing protein [Paraglaciecola arctica]